MSLIRSFEPDERLRNDGRMGIHGFRRLLRSDKWGSIMTHESQQYRPEHMHEPMWRYFISSSHNSYLSGSQLYGAANTLAYYYAIQCYFARMVERELSEYL